MPEEGENKNVLWMQERIERSAVIVPTSNRFLESRCQCDDEQMIRCTKNADRVEKVVVNIENVTKDRAKYRNSKNKTSSVAKTKKKKK